MHFQCKAKEEHILTIVPIYEDSKILKSPFVNWAMKKNEIFVLNNELIINLGKAVSLTSESFREAAGEIARYLYRTRERAVQVDCSFLQHEYLSENEILKAFVEGWLLGVYRFQKYRKQYVDYPIKNVILTLEHSEEVSEVIEIATNRANSVIVTRDLCNTDPIDLNPDQFATKIQEHFTAKNLQVKIYDREQLEEMNMQGILAVGRASNHGSYLAEVSLCTDSTKPHIVLVGKGMTYDCGGISIKTAKNISDMRMDMGGAGAVFGAMDLLASDSSAVNVTALIPIAENLPNERAFLPGEVIKFANNLHVQVGNTDAEGRLILADAFLYAERLNANVLVDIATLTGSIGTSLGMKCAGVFGDELITNLMKKISFENGDYVWPMPLFDAYEQSLQSEYADVCNISSDDVAGAITAALFLRKFVPSKVRWAHIDMAATVHAKNTAGYYTQGASGYGVRLLKDFVEQYSLV